MVNRFFELMLVAVLLVLTVGTVFQVLNHHLLREIHGELRRSERQAPAPPAAMTEPAAAAPAAPVHASPQAPVAPQDPALPPAVEPEPALAPAVASAAKPEVIEESTAQAPAPEIAEDASEPAAPQIEPDTPTAEAAAPNEAESPEWQRHGEQVQQFVRQLYRGEHVAVARHFTPDLAENFPVDLLGKQMQDLIARHGDFEAFEIGWLDRELQTPDLLPFRLPVRTARDRQLLFTIWLTPDEKIKGLSFRLLE